MRKASLFFNFCRFLRSEHCDLGVRQADGRSLGRLRLFWGGLLRVQRALRRSEHQLDAVELVDLTRTGVIVDSDNVCAGIGRAQRLDEDRKSVV